MNRVIALACALDPLARSAFLPEHFAPDADAVLELDAFALSLLLLVPALLLSLPQADSSSVPAASRLTAAPDRLSFT